MMPNHALQRTAAGSSRLQSVRLVAAVAELGSLDPRRVYETFFSITTAGSAHTAAS